MAFINWNPLTEVIYLNLNDIEVECKVESIRETEITYSLNTYRSDLFSNREFKWNDLYEEAVEKLRIQSKQDIPEDCEVRLGGFVEFTENLQQKLVTFIVKD